MCHYRPLKGPFKVSLKQNDIMASDNNDRHVR